MKLFFSRVGKIIILISVLHANSIGANELRFLNWADYMDPEILEAFTKKTGIKVNEIYFDSDDTRDQLLLESNGKGYDLAVINGASLYVLGKRGWLEALNDEDIPNSKYIDSKWKNFHDGAGKFGIPYFWGTLGIAYRKDLVDREVTGWMDLFDPHESTQGKIGMISDPRDMIGAALKGLNFSFNSENREEIGKAEQLLNQQKPYVKTYKYISLDETSAMVSGEVVMSMMYSGDALMLQEQNENIKYVLPKEGGGVWIDYLSILKESVNKEAAKKFINFLNEPEIAKKLAEYVYCATPNSAAEKLLPKEFVNNEFIYPSQNALEKSEFYKRLKPRASKRRSIVFSRIIN